MCRKKGNVKLLPKKNPTTAPIRDNLNIKLITIMYVPSKNMFLTLKNQIIKRVLKSCKAKANKVH